MNPIIIILWKLSQMKNIKNSIILITLSCFIGQLLVGCNAGNQVGATSIKSFDKKATFTQKQLQEMKV